MKFFTLTIVAVAFTLCGCQKPDVNERRSERVGRSSQSEAANEETATDENETPDDEDASSDQQGGDGEGSEASAGETSGDSARMEPAAPGSSGGSLSETPEAAAKHGEQALKNAAAAVSSGNQQAAFEELTEAYSDCRQFPESSQCQEVASRIEGQLESLESSVVSKNSAPAEGKTLISRP